MSNKPRKTLRWGLLGAGDIAAKQVAKCMAQLPEVELVAACRRDESQLAAFAETFEIPRTYTDRQSLFADTQVDAIYISTPHDCHCRHTVEAARAGKHVLVEKPMAMNAEECRQMIRACRESHVRLGVSYYRRTLPMIIKAKQILDCGDIGRTVLFRVFYPSGMVDLPNDDARAWLMQRSAGGGSLLGVGSHVIDLMLYLGGEIVELAGTVDRVVTGGDADDLTAMVCRFRSGALGMMNSSYNCPGGICPFDISASAGRLTFDAISQGSLSFQRHGQTQNIQAAHPPSDQRYLELIRSFTRHVLSDTPFAISGEQAMRTNVVMDALYRASQTRQWACIDWDRETDY